MTRMHVLVLAVATALTMVTTQAFAEAPATPDGSLKVYWKDGLRLDTADKALRLKIGGRLFNDWAWFDEDQSVENAFGRSDDGTEFGPL